MNELFEMVYSLRETRTQAGKFTNYEEAGEYVQNILDSESEWFMFSVTGTIPYPDRRVTVGCVIFTKDDGTKYIKFGTRGGKDEWSPSFTKSSFRGTSSSGAGLMLEFKISENTPVYIKTKS